MDKLVNRIKLEDLSSSSVFQTKLWAQVKSTQLPFAFEFISNNRKMDVLVLVKKLVLNTYLAYIPFAFDDKITSEEIIFFATAIKKYLPKNTIMLKLDLLYSVVVKNKKLHLNKNCIQPKSSIVINLPEEFELKTRAKRANKKSSLVVTSVEKTDKNIALWYNLYKSTAKNKGFFTRSFEYFNSLLNINDDNIILYFAKDDEKLVGAIINIRGREEELYLFGASLQVSLAGYALQQTAIKNAIEAGIKRYDLYGIGDAEHKNLNSLNLFKESFGGKKVQRIGTLDYNYNIVGSLFNFIDSLRYLYYAHKL